MEYEDFMNAKTNEISINAQHFVWIDRKKIKISKDPLAKNIKEPLLSPDDQNSREIFEE